MRCACCTGCARPASPAYLVGGAVRDLLVGGHPKDFDVATDATPGAGQAACSATAA